MSAELSPKRLNRIAKQQREGIKSAKLFASQLPESPQPNHIGTGVMSGTIYFGWLRFLPTRRFFVTIHPCGALHWIGQWLDTHANGKEKLADTLSPIVAKWIARFKEDTP